MNHSVDNCSAMDVVAMQQAIEAAGGGRSSSNGRDHAHAHALASSAQHARPGGPEMNPLGRNSTLLKKRKRVVDPHPAANEREMQQHYAMQTLLGLGAGGQPSFLGGNNFIGAQQATMEMTRVVSGHSQIPPSMPHGFGPVPVSATPMSTPVSLPVAVGVGPYPGFSQQELDAAQQAARNGGYLPQHSTTADSPALPLYSVLRQHPDNVALVSMMLQMFPAGAGMPLPSPPPARRSSEKFLGYASHGGFCRAGARASRRGGVVPPTERGSYPLHVALRNGARTSADTVRLLIRHAPDVLLERDALGRVPLSVALAHGASREVVYALLRSGGAGDGSGDGGYDGDGRGEEAAHCPDDRSNLPLHHACLRRYPLPVIRSLAEACPAAGRWRNFDGRTPLQLAQQRGWTSDEVVTYLQVWTARSSR